MSDEVEEERERESADEDVEEEEQGVIVDWEGKRECDRERHE